MLCYLHSMVNASKICHQRHTIEYFKHLLLPLSIIYMTFYMVLKMLKARTLNGTFWRFFLSYARQNLEPLK